MINKNQYRLLCELTDKLLNVDGVKTERVAISMLHVMRAHPIFLSRYESLFVDLNSKLALIKKLYHFVFQSCIQLLKSLNSPRILPGGLNLNKPTFIFVSHLINESHIDEESDFYFGDLPQKLALNDYHSIVSLINHTSLKHNFYKKNPFKKGMNKILLAKRLNFIEEIKILISCFKESVTLRREAKSCSQPILKKIILKASEEVLSQETFQNLRIGYQIRDIVKKYQPKAIITIFEGHAWERIVFSEARMANQSIHCFGYQHAALFKNQHAIRRPISNRFNPDTILTSGKLGFEQLVNDSSYTNVSIGILGSHKNMFPKIKDKNTEENICLVIPEGTESECKILFEFSLRCANKFPTMKFIWRVHPILNIEEISTKLFSNNKLPENIHLSKSTLEDDLNKAKWALYRGTTTIVQAVLSGVFPVYFDTQGFNIDPLYSVSDEIFYIKNDYEFHDLVANFQNIDHINSSLLKLKNSLKDFYTPINLDVLYSTIS